VPYQLLKEIVDFNWLAVDYISSGEIGLLEKYITYLRKLAKILDPVVPEYDRIIIEKLGSIRLHAFQSLVERTKKEEDI